VWLVKRRLVNVFIIGARANGSLLCEKFSLDHEGTVIDRDSAVVQIADDLSNVGVVCVHQCSAKVVIDAGIYKCDVFIVVASDDEFNILSCSIENALEPK
jgi:Trk K+ transport system NAD-binding subunit